MVTRVLMGQQQHARSFGGARTEGRLHHLTQGDVASRLLSTCSIGSCTLTVLLTEGQCFVGPSTIITWPHIKISLCFTSMTAMAG